MTVLPSYRNQFSGFYMRITLAFNGLKLTKIKCKCDIKKIMLELITLQTGKFVRKETNYSKKCFVKPFD